MRFLSKYLNLPSRGYFFGVLNPLQCKQDFLAVMFGFLHKKYIMTLMSCDKFHRVNPIKKWCNANLIAEHLVIFFLQIKLSFD